MSQSSYQEQLDRIKKKLDMIIEFFNIHPDRVPERSRKELREKAMAKVYKLQQQQPAKSQPNGRKKTCRK